MFHLLYNFASQVTKITETIINRKYATCGPTEFLIPLVDVKRFVLECFCSVGVSEANATVMAESLALADTRGIKSEGVGRLPIYIKDIYNGICNPKAEPTIETESAAVATVNGNDGLGPVTGRFCMDLAIEKALVTGVGMVAAKGSNHFGMASLYTIQAVDKGYIGLSMSNSYPVMVPPGGIYPVLGSNPISLGAPAHCDDLVLDMATTATTIAKVMNDGFEEYTEKQIKMYEQMHMELPKDWALNDKGVSERSARSALMYKRLCPLGADQSHKGFGLGLLVEVLTGVLADSNYGTKIPEYRMQKSPPKLGHSFIAINPEKFVPNFATRLSKYLKQLRCKDCADAQIIFVPGDKERARMKEIESDGIRLTKTQVDYMEKLAKKFCINPLDSSFPLSMKKQQDKRSEQCSKR